MKFGRAVLVLDLNDIDTRHGNYLDRRKEAVAAVKSSNEMRYILRPTGDIEEYHRYPNKQGYKVKTIKHIGNAKPNEFCWCRKA